ncbi:MAG: hypothetical protein ACT4OE_06205 [Sphingosinicella sp.]
MSRASLILLVFVALAACHAEIPAQRNKAERIDQSNRHQGIECPEGFAVYPLDPRACMSVRQIRYGQQRNYDGTLVAGLERMEFYPRGSDIQLGAGYWLYFNDPRVEACLFDLGAASIEPTRFQIRFLGRPALDARRGDGEGYGHMGMHSRALILDRFLSSNPCG